MLLSELDQVLAALLQPAVGVMGDGLGALTGGVHNDAVQARLFDKADHVSRFGGDGEQHLDTLFADALSPARPVGGINGQFGLQIDFTAKILPAGIL